MLNMGSGAGLLAMEVLRMGAHHVTCSERWLYLAMACKELLLSNGFSDDQVATRTRLRTFFCVPLDDNAHYQRCVCGLTRRLTCSRSVLIWASTRSLRGALFPDCSIYSS